MQMDAHIYMHVFKETKTNSYMYVSQTELLTQTANEGNTEMKIFSTEKPQTPNQEHDYHMTTNNTYNSLLCLETVSSVYKLLLQRSSGSRQDFYQQSFVSFGKRRRV